MPKPPPAWAHGLDHGVLGQDNKHRRGNIRNRTRVFSGDHPPQRPDFSQSQEPATIVANGIRSINGNATATPSSSQSADAPPPDPLPKRPVPSADPKPRDHAQPTATTPVSRQAQSGPTRAARDTEKPTPCRPPSARTKSSTNSSTQNTGTKRPFHATVESDDELECDKERSYRRRPRPHTLRRSSKQNTQSEASGE